MSFSDKFNKWTGADKIHEWQTKSVQNNIKQMEANIEKMKIKNKENGGKNTDAIKRFEMSLDNLKKRYPEK